MVGFEDKKPNKLENVQTKQENTVDRNKYKQQ